MDRRIPIPSNEEFRLSVLEDLNIFNTNSDAQLDRLVKIGQSHFDVPVCLVTLIGKTTQCLKARIGVDTDSMPRDIAFCAYGIMNDEPLIVLDTHKDGRFRNNPLVTGDPFLRFYAGAPLIAQTGVRLGTFCILDTKPRTAFSSHKAETLQDFAAQAVAVILSNRKMERLADRYSELTSEIKDDSSAAAKRQIISIANHEFRTPLNAILGFSDIVARGNAAPEDIAECVGYIHTAAKGLQRIIENLMTFESFESGEFRLTEAPFDFRAVIDRAVENVGLRLLAEQVEVVVTGADADLPLYKGDRVQIEQAITQLLDNAIKASPQGEQVNVQVDLDEFSNVALSVSDSGPGLSHEDFTKACQAFGKLGDVNDGGNDGLGFGLCITEIIIQTHGGMLELVQAPTPGTTVRMTFPHYRAVEVDHPAAAQRKAS